MRINFEQQRNFNQTFIDIIAFAKENYKNLGVLLLNWAGPFILIAAISATYLQADILAYGQKDATIAQQYQAMTTSTYYWATILFNLVSNTILMAIVFAYIKNYIQKGAENISHEFILEDVKANFLLILSTNLVVGFTILAGLFLFIVGAIFAFVAFSLTIIVRLYENKTLSEALSRSFFLVKNNWWDTASKLVALYLMVLLSEIIFSVPEQIYSGISAINWAEINKPPITYVVLSSFTNFASGLFTAVLYIGTAFIYFNLIEKEKV